MRRTAAVILAAGFGTRMKYDFPKVIRPLAGQSMLEYVIGVAEGVGIQRIVVVVGFKGDLLVELLAGKDVEIVWQKEMRGTADAVNAARDAFVDFKGDILVLYGDVPLLRTETIKRLLSEYRKSGVSCTLLSVYLTNPAGYGRVIRRENGEVRGIVEEIDATPEEKRIKEVNAGVYCFNAKDLFESLKEVKPHNRKGEYYLTDVVKILVENGKGVKAVMVEDKEEVLGINSQEDLLSAERILAKRRCGSQIMKAKEEAVV